MSRDYGIIGVSDHGGWAVLVTVAGDGTLLDRRRVELVDEDLPKIPHHSEGQALPLHEAVALVERVRVSAERHAKLGLDAVAMTVPGRILGVALRNCPVLPPTTAERIKDYRAQNVADWVMYRRALAAAAEARGWAVHWYDAKKVFDAASEALGIEDLDAPLPPVEEVYRAALGQGSQDRDGSGDRRGQGALELEAGSRLDGKARQVTRFWPHLGAPVVSCIHSEGAQRLIDGSDSGSFVRVGDHTPAIGIEVELCNAFYVLFPRNSPRAVRNRRAARAGRYG